MANEVVLSLRVFAKAYQSLAVTLADHAKDEVMTKAGDPLSFFPSHPVICR